MQLNTKHIYCLPWRNRDVPHALLDINRICDINCPACYNTRDGRSLTLDEVRKDLDILQRERRLDSVSIIGGEPLLHPELDAVVAMVHGRGLGCELFTNGVRLSDERLQRLAELGVNVIFVHVEKGQQRPDLKRAADDEDVGALRLAMAAAIRRHGMEAGMSVTARLDRGEEMLQAMRDCIDSDSITYLLITLERDVQGIEGLRGSVAEGFSGRHVGLDGAPAVQQTDSPLDAAAIIAERLELQPFAYVGSNRCGSDPRWLSYQLAVGHCDDHPAIVQSVRPSLLEAAYIHLYRLLRGRFPFYARQRERGVEVALRLNGLLGGDRLGNRRFLRAAKASGGKLRTLRVLIQAPAFLEPDGTLTYCRDCPDAVVVDGKLVPVCISDRVASRTTERRARATATA